MIFCGNSSKKIYLISKYKNDHFVNLFSKLRNSISNPFSFRHYSAFGFGFPVILTLILLVADEIMNGILTCELISGIYYCNFDSGKAEWSAFYLPSMLIQALSLTFFASATFRLRQLWSSNESTTAQKLSVESEKYRIYLVIFVMQFIIYLVNMFMSGTQFFLLLLNNFMLIVQAIVIFGICVLKENVRKLIIEKFQILFN